MALMDEFKEERKAVLQNGTMKQKVSYIWDYYKWHIIIPTLIIIAITSYIVKLVTAPDIIMNGVMLNVYNLESAEAKEALLTDFYKEQKINTKEEEITFNTNLHYATDDATYNYDSAQALMAWIATGQVDFITGNVSALTDLAYNDYFTDLRNYLTDEQLEKYEPYFLYMDYDVYQKRSEIIDDTEASSVIELPDCAKPEEMKDPVPVMIDVSQCEKLKEVYGNTPETLAFGVTVKETHKEMTSAFLDYLME